MAIIEFNMINETSADKYENDIIARLYSILSGPRLSDDKSSILSV